MQHKAVMTTQKIVILITFICVALITSVFIFHAKQPAKVSELSSDIGLIFQAPRDIKTFELISTQKQKFTQQQLYQHWTLLFFGFTHCSNVCPVTLDLLKHTYDQLQSSYPNLQIVFISLDPERDTPDALKEYLASYNPQFIGASNKIAELHKIQSNFGIFSAKESSGTHENYQIQHTSSLILLNPQGKWVALFNYGLKPEQLILGVQTAIQVHR